MEYIYYQVGRKKRIIESKLPLSENQIKRLVGENIDFFPLKNGTTACVNEEGVLEGLPINPAITENDTDADIGGGIRGDILIGRVGAKDEFIGIK